MSIRQIRFFVTMLAITAATMIQAQATRTWVSGVGDDVNPCSRTAPCKTFAGAISKTAAAGEISVLDPGGFGAVTITKAIRIDGKGVVAGILASLTNGIIINAGTGRVTIANVQINGAGNGLDGVRILSAGAVVIQSCDITNFAGDGIEIATSTSTPVTVVDTNISFMPTGSGILSNTTAGTVNLSVSNSTIAHNLRGINTKIGTIASVSRSTIANNTTGLQADNASIINLDSNQIDHNGTGIQSLANSSVIRLYGNFIQNNSTNGFNVTAPSTITSAQNNSIQTSPGNVGVLGNMGQQ